MKQDIKRVRMVDADKFWHEYIYACQPAVIEGLFDGQPITKIKNIQSLKEALGSTRIEIREEFSSALFKPNQAEAVDTRLSSTVSEYIDLVDSNTGTELMCLNIPPPDSLLHLFDVPDVCTHMDSAASGRSRYDITFRFFLGNAGNRSHLHFDTDQRHVLFYQAVGRKRAILIRPREAKKLNPFRVFSRVFWENMTDREQAKFLDYTDAYDAILHPGDALFMPALIWHHMDYIDTGMSFNIRFGRNKYNRFFGDHLHQDMHLQNVALNYINEKLVNEELESDFAALRTLYASSLDEEEKFRRIQNLYERLYAKYCPDSIQGIYMSSTCEHTLVDWVNPRGFYAKAIGS